MSLSVNSIHRSLSTMAIEVNRAVARKSAANAVESLGEVDQQFQADIGGTAGGWAWETVELDFEETFYDAPAQRDADLDEPTFTFGSVIVTGPPMMVTAHVSKWKRNDEDNFTGAFVRVGVWNPASTADQDPATFERFTGRVHLNFQGFAAPSDPDEDN
jgi:hypothetical protein